MVKTLSTKVKRGDTVIEVMFAFAVFALVAILSIAMMNSGVATSERSLELVVARNELNAQAEALRFIHSSYVSELTLPTCDEVENKDDKCQQFQRLWKDYIIANAIDIGTYAPNIPTPVDICNDNKEDSDNIYAHDNQRLRNVNAFVLNTRKINTLANSQDANDIRAIYVSVKNGGQDIFQPAPLGARLVYSTNYSAEEEGDNSSMQQSGKIPVNYTNLIRAEGIWVVAIKGDKKSSDDSPQYYDFRIQTCWYGSGNAAPTTLDTVIRLNNPEILK